MTTTALVCSRDLSSAIRAGSPGWMGSQPLPGLPRKHRRLSKVIAAWKPFGYFSCTEHGALDMSHAVITSSHGDLFPGVFMRNLVLLSQSAATAPLPHGGESSREKVCVDACCVDFSRQRVLLALSDGRLILCRSTDHKASWQLIFCSSWIQRSRL